MKTPVLISTLLLTLAGTCVQAAVVEPLQGSTQNPQWQYAGTDARNPEWFSRYSPELSTAVLQAFKNAPGNASGLDLYARSGTVEVTYLGTGATRDSNLFLAWNGSGGFDSSAFWAPVYASGGSNNLAAYNPVTSANGLFSTRAGCSFAQAKNGNSCLATQIGLQRVISGLDAGDQLVFGLQALPLVYNANGSSINLPHTHYFFTGTGSNNTDSRGWADGQMHAKVLQLGEDEFLVGFEDMWLGQGSTSDRDYNDMVFLFRGVSVTPVPEPESSAMLLGGTALLGLVARRRHTRRA